MHWFTGLVIVKTMCKESSFVHHALEYRLLLPELRLSLQLWENSFAAGKGFRYVDQVKVLVKESLYLKSSQMPVYGVVYFAKVLHKGYSSSIELTFFDSILVK